jgi:hypothetical protein
MVALGESSRALPRGPAHSHWTDRSALSSMSNSVDMPRQDDASRVMDPDQMGLISSRLRPVVRGPISAITAIVAASAATTTVNIAAAP